MSLQGNAGASTAAGEILDLVKQKLDENKDKPDVVKVLKEIEVKAQQIKDSADSGWY